MYPDDMIDPRIVGKAVQDGTTQLTLRLLDTERQLAESQAREANLDTTRQVLELRLKSQVFVTEKAQARASQDKTRLQKYIDQLQTERSQIDDKRREWKERAVKAEADCKMYEAMKDGVEIRIADLQSELAKAREQVTRLTCAVPGCTEPVAYLHALQCSKHQAALRQHEDSGKSPSGKK